MGLGPGVARLYLELWQRGVFQNIKSVVDMGSQELMLTQPQFREMMRESCITNYNEADFANLDYFPGQPRMSARAFYQLLGIEKYNSVDINGEHGAIRHDLNLPFEDSTRFGQYDLVTDYGSNEHVFNIVEPYRTMHRLCKPGGVLVNSQCVVGGNGYYNFDPSFFEGMAAANGYRILYCAFVVVLKKRYLSKSENRHLPVSSGGDYGFDEYHIPLSQELLDIFNWSTSGAHWSLAGPEVNMCYVFQKESDDDFQLAYQGGMQARVQGHAGFQIRFLPNPPSRTYVPLLEQTLERELEVIGGGLLARHLLGRLRRRVKSRLRLR